MHSYMEPLERDRLTRIETKVDLLIEQTEKRLEIIEVNVKANTDFITNLKGKLAVVGAGFTLMGGIIVYGISKIIDAVTSVGGSH